MRIVVICVLFLFSDIHLGMAQRLQFFGDFETLDVLAFAQCELGLWAKQVRLPLPTGKERALVSAEGTETRTYNADVKGSWFVSAEAGYKSEVSQIAEITRVRNIHPDNDGACIKNRPPVGVLQCLTTNARNYPDDTIKCTTKVSATASGGLGAKFNLWVVGAEASGKVASTRAYNIVVTLPKPN
jgi:hypothetical protein